MTDLLLTADYPADSRLISFSIGRLTHHRLNSSKLKRKLTPLAPIRRYLLQWCVCLEILATMELLAIPGFHPGRAGWQIHLARDRALLSHRGHQQVRPKHELVDKVNGSRISGEIVVERAHRRRTMLVGRPVELSQIGLEFLAQEEQVADNLVISLTKGPDLITRPGRLRAIQPIERLANTMQAEQWTEDTVLEPAHNQLFEIIGTNVACHESANIRCPPGDAAHGYVQPGWDLRAQHLEARADIS